MPEILFKRRDGWMKLEIIPADFLKNRMICLMCKRDNNFSYARHWKDPNELPSDDHNGYERCYFRPMETNPHVWEECR